MRMQTKMKRRTREEKGEEDDEQQQSRTAVLVLGPSTEGLVEVALGKLAGKPTAAEAVQWIAESAARDKRAFSQREGSA